MGWFLGITVKMVASVGAWTDTLNYHKYEMSMAWEPDRRFNFFSSPTHLCAVTCITEMSLIVT